MTYSTYVVRKKFKDPAKITLPDGTIIDGNRNNIAVLEFPNDDGVSQPVTYFANGDNLSDATIDAQARDIIASLNAQEVGLKAITVGITKAPDAPDAKQQAVAEAARALQIAARDAQIKAFNDSDATAALQALQAAEAAVKG